MLVDGGREAEETEGCVVVSISCAASACVRVRVRDTSASANHVEMLWTIPCSRHSGRYRYGFLTLFESGPPLHTLSPSVADMGLLNRLLFILLHDWNYRSSTE